MLCLGDSFVLVVFVFLLFEVRVLIVLFLLIQSFLYLSKGNVFFACVNFLASQTHTVSAYGENVHSVA